MKLECCVLRDLLALYVEDMVSPQTAEALRQHLAQCPECRAEYENYQKDGHLHALENAEPADNREEGSFRRIMGRLQRQLYGLAYGMIFFFLLLGFSLTGGEDLMYNSLIMPLAGVFGYCVFRWRALYKMPVLVLVVDLIPWCLGFGEVDIFSVFPWTFLYSVFVILGVVIAFLLHFALRKESKV